MTRLGGSFRVRSGDCTVTCKAEPLDHDFDPKRLTKPVADAIADAIERGIANNSQKTADGKRRLFVRTGRLARSIESVRHGDGYQVVAPPGYLQDDALMERLIETVPVLADPFVDRAVESALDKVTDGVFKKGRM